MNSKEHCFLLIRRSLVRAQVEEPIKGLRFYVTPFFITNSASPPSIRKDCDIKIEYIFDMQKEATHLEQLVTAIASIVSYGLVLCLAVLFID